METKRLPMTLVMPSLPGDADAVYGPAGFNEHHPNGRHRGLGYENRKRHRSDPGGRLGRLRRQRHGIGQG
jgi:hypothetical protein